MESLSSPYACEVPAAALAVMSDADFADAFVCDLNGTFSAYEAARQIFKGSPNWMQPLLALRNLMVKPFGLISTADTALVEQRIGLFPLLSVAEDQIVLGLDDKHLDFRLVVNATSASNRTHIVVSTVLKRHNLLGKLYLAIVLPFHKLVVPAFLRGAQSG